MVPSGIHQCVLSAQQAKCTLGCIKRRVASKLKQWLFPLCSILVRSHLHYCLQAWSPQQKKDVELLEKAQQSAMRIIRGSERHSYEARLSQAHSAWRKGGSG